MANKENETPDVKYEILKTGLGIFTLVVGAVVVVLGTNAIVGGSLIDLLNIIA